MLDSLCDDVRFCAQYAHMHCSSPACRAILPAIGGGGDDGRGIDGYEDEHGNAARVCTECADSSALLCKACFDVDPGCGACRAAAHCSEASCNECRQGAA